MRRLSLLLVIFSTAALAAPITPAAIVGSDGSDLLIPIAGRAQGFGGELFVTDVTLTNFGPEHQSVELTWLPQGGTAEPMTRQVLVQAYSIDTLEDVVGSLFETSGIGAIRVRGVDESGAPDDGSVIDAHARIWTETTCADLTGTVSQSVPSIVMDAGWRGGSGAYAHGVHEGPQYRTNYGIVNPTDAPIQFVVYVNSEAGRRSEVVVVPANGMIQRPVPVGVQGELSVYVEPLGNPPNLWRAYASSVDNRSGSGWTVVAMQPRADPPYLN